MADKYLILLGDKSHKVIAKTFLTSEHVEPVTNLDGYWKIRACVRKPSKAGGVGLFDSGLKKMGIATWKAWPCPAEGEPVLGKTIDDNPYPEFKDEGWENAMKEYAEYIAAKKEEGEKKPAVTEAPAAPAVISASKQSGVISGGWKAKVAAALTAEEKKAMMRDVIAFFFG